MITILQETPIVHHQLKKHLAYSIKMRAASSLVHPLVPLLPSQSFTLVTLFPPKSSGSFVSRSLAVKATTTAVGYDTTTTVDYSSLISVFPAEACETIGGDACLADIYPEARPQPEARSNQIASEGIEREYLEYNNLKTVFCGEACDDLGGEFCSREYQRGVY